MSLVTADLSMSLDGFIALPDDSIGPLFDWYGNGDVDLVMPGDHPAAHARMTAASAEFFSGVLARAGSIVSGRRVFDHTNGWDGMHPVGCPVVVLTHAVPREWVEKHPDAPFTFVTEGGIEAAVELAKDFAGDKDVSMAGPSLITQAANAGLLDEVVINLVPVLLGEGIRYFGPLDGITTLENPTVVQGDRVTHLQYVVRR